jgi:hypothetical protein
MSRTHFLTAIVVAGIFLTAACNSSNTEKKEESQNSAQPSESTNENEGNNPKGIGPHQNVQLTHPLDEKMIASGQSIYDVKCSSCHKLSEEKLVGPGWKGVTDRRTPEWIMNFVTNTDEMMEKDTAAQHMLEVCLVKMPNQNLTEEDARSVLEYMRKNDGKN